MTNYPAHSRQGWDPLLDLQSLRAEFSRMMGAALAGLGRGLVPELEVTTDEQGWQVTARLPGVAPDEVAIDVDERELCIRRRPPEEREATQDSDDFELRVSLPSDVEVDKVDATMDHGLLRVHLPRTAARSSRRSVQVGRGRAAVEGADTV